MSWRKPSFAMLLVASFAAGLFLFVPAQDAAGPRVVVALAAVPDHPSHLVAAPGFVEPASETYVISASAFGRLITMKAEEGAKVAAGEVIAEIENSDLQSQLRIAEAELKVRDSELARLQAGARDQERSQAAAALREADATSSLARTELTRQTSLVGGGAVSQATLDRARSDFAAADARRALLAEKLSLIQAPPRSEDVAIAEARVEDAQAHIAEAKALIEKTMIRSPIDGVLLRRYARVGEMMSLQPPTLIAEIGDVSRLRVRAHVDEADVGRVAVGQEVWITADAYPNRRFRGRVAQVGDIMGDKRFRTDRPGERLDTKVLEALIDLEPRVKMPVGLRVDVLFDEPGEGDAAVVKHSGWSAAELAADSAAKTAAAAN